jgi:putative peptidoglycan lipid II flippase
MVLPNLFTLVIQTSFGSALVPVISRVEAKMQSAEANSIALGKCYAVIGLGALVSLALFLLSGDLLRFVTGELTEQETKEAIRYVSSLATLPFLASISASFGAVAGTRGKFKLVNSFNLILNLSVICGTLFFGNTVGAESIVVGTVIAYALHALLILIWVNYKILPGTKPRVKVELLTAVLSLAWPMVVVIAFQQIVVVVERLIALGLGMGAVSSLNYAARLTSFIPTIVGAPLCNVLLPYLAKNHEAGNQKEISDTIKVLLRYTVMLAVPLAIMIISFRREIIMILLEGGRFDKAATDETESPMLWLALAAPIQTVREIIVRLYYAAHDSINPMRLGFIRMIANIAGCLLLSKYLGVSGIASAYTLALGIEVGLLYCFRFKLAQTIEEFWYALKILTLSTGGYLIANTIYFSATTVINVNTKAYEALWLVLSIAIGIATSIVIIAAMGQKEGVNCLRFVFQITKRVAIKQGLLK